jgi:FkbH-like protein
MARDQAAPVQDREAWLQDLGLTLRFDRIADARHSRYARALELLNKTNQFNTTGQRWSDAEMRVWLGAGGRLLAASAEDRFANHGLIALALLRDNEIVQVVLSCRVFGLGIETALLAEALRQMQEAGYTDYVGRFTATGRNDACRAFWPAHGYRIYGPDFFPIYTSTSSPGNRFMCFGILNLKRTGSTRTSTFSVLWLDSSIFGVT